MKNMFNKFVLAGTLAVGMAASPSWALDGVVGLAPVDSGVWSSPEADFQGLVFQYAPVATPALVAYWFTYDQNGRQAWFVSDNIPLTGDAQGSSSFQVDFYKPMGNFASSPGSLGDPVATIIFFREGEQLLASFGILPITGFGADCADNLSRPIGFPVQAPSPGDQYTCQGVMTVNRVFREIPELDGILIGD